MSNVPASSGDELESILNSFFTIGTKRHISELKADILAYVEQQCTEARIDQMTEDLSISHESIRINRDEFMADQKQLRNPGGGKGSDEH